MEKMRRYAIYYAPEPGSFATAATNWLGWDPEAGEIRHHPDLPGLVRPVADITEDPRKYGFHGTIKPPFRLAKGCNVDDLHAALRDLSAHLVMVEIPGLAIQRIGRFLAFCPTGNVEALEKLAANTVRALDDFRAPLTDVEIAHRRPEHLSAAQRALLDRWGYPFVMEEFRFHLTVTGPLTVDEIEVTEAVIIAYFAPVLPIPFRVAELCLFGEAEKTGCFHLIHRYPLVG